MSDEKENMEIMAVGGAVSNVDDIIAIAERRMAKHQKLIDLSLKITNAQDWINQQGKPYLTASGAEKIGRLWGVSVRNVRREKTMTEDEKGSFYFYEYRGTFELGNGVDLIEAVGTCSQKDEFFAMAYGELKPLSEIEETNILKSAYSNMMVNGITRLLGLRNLTMDQLKGAGIDVGKITRVEYEVGAKGGSKESEWSESERAKAKEIGNELMAQYNGDAEAAAVKLELLTAFTAKDGKAVKGRRSIKKLSGKQINILYEKVFPKEKTNGNGNDKGDPYDAFDDKPVNEKREPGDDDLFPGK